MAQHRAIPQPESRSPPTTRSPRPRRPCLQPLLPAPPPLHAAAPPSFPSRLLPDKMAAAARWAALGLALWLCAAARAEEPEGKRRAGPAKKKDIRDYNDADMARLLEQWEVRGGAGGPRWGLHVRPEERAALPRHGRGLAGRQGCPGVQATL